jgi:hypothetical protein
MQPSSLNIEFDFRTVRAEPEWSGQLQSFARESLAVSRDEQITAGAVIGFATERSRGLVT